MTDTSAPPVKKKRVPIWLRWGGGIVLFLILLLLAARITIGTSFGRNLVESQIESRTFSGQQITLEGFEGDILSRASIARLTIRDSEGIWAEASDVTLGWSPLKLIGRHLSLSDLTASELSVFRRPEIVSDENPEPDEPSGEFPLRSIELSNLDVDRLFLADGVVQREVAASVHAEMSWTPAAALLDVDVQPEAEGGDRLLGRVNWTPDQPLRGRLELDGPSGGLFANLLQLNADDSVNAVFDATGDEDAVRAHLEAKINNADWLDVTTTPTEAGQTLNALVSLAQHPLTASHIARLGPELRLTGDYELSDVLESLSLRAELELLTLTLENIAQTDDEIAVDLALTTRQLSRLAGTQNVSAANLSLTGHVSRQSDGGIQFNGALAGDDLVAPNFSGRTIAGPLTANLTGGVLTVTPQIEVSRAVIQNGDRRVPLRFARLNGVARMALDDMTLTLDQMRISTPQSRLTASGTASLGDAMALNLGGNTTLNLSELGVYEQGAIAGRWQVRQSAGASTYRFNANLTGQNLASEGDPLRDWLGQSVTLVLSGQADQSGRVTLPELTLASAAFDLSGQFSRSSAGELQSTIQLVTKEVYPMAELLPGARIAADISGPADQLSLQLRANAAALHSGDTAIADPDLGFNGVFSGGVLDGRLQLAGLLEGEPLRIATDARLDGASWQANALTGAWRDLTMSGDVSGEGGDIGAIRGDFELAGSLPEGLMAQSVDLSAQIQASSIAVSGLVDGVELGVVENGTVDLDIRGALDELRYDVALRGITRVSGFPQDASVQLVGEARDLDTALRSATGDLNARLGAEEIATTQPFRFAQTETGYLGDIQLALFGGTAALRLDDDPDARLIASMSSVQLPRLLVATGRAPLNGALDLSLRLRENEGQLVGTLNGKTADVALPDSDMSPVTFFLNGVIENEQADIRLRSAEGQVLQARLEASLPLVTRADGLSISLDDQRAGGFSGTLGGRVDNIAALALPDRTVLTGAIDASFTGDFPFDPETLNGHVRMNDGMFEQGELGAVLQAITFDLRLANQNLSLNDFSASGRSGGSLTGSGAFSLNGSGQSNLRLEARQLVLADRFEGRATASGVFGVELQDESIVVTGDLTLDEGHVYLDRLPSSSGITTLDVTFNDEPEPEEVEERTVQLDVSLNAPRRLYVTGSGMDAELSLQSRITGTLADISIDGRADIVRGRFDLLGKRFDFVDSAVFLEGDPMEARLDITAEREADDLISRVMITGTPARPDVELGSSPELPQDEVLSRVLFGRSPSQLTALEAARLAAALAQMGGGGGFDLMGGIEQLVGLDALDVRQNASGQFEVSTGRYLSEDVYLEVTSDALGNAGVSVEWEPRENISVKADTTPGEGEELTIEWTRDFD